eukprot:318055_1
MSSLTVKQGIINMCNTSIGLGVLAKPFALGVSGWIGIVSFVLAASIMIYVGSLLSWSTSKILINDHDEKQKPIVNEQPRAQESDHDESTPVKSNNKSKSAWRRVCYASLGQRGGALGVLSFLIINMSLMLSGCIMIWELITDILDIFKIDLINPTSLYLITYILYFTSSMVLNWKQMTFISNISVIAVITVALTVSGICIYSLSKYNFSSPPIAEMAVNSTYINVNSNNIALNARKGMSEMDRVTFVFVLFIFGMSANSCIPSITVNLKQPSKITLIVGTSYILVTCFNICIGSMGYWLYGEYADVMVLNDFYLWPGGFLMLIVTILVILNLWGSFSMCLTLISEVFDVVFKLELNQKGYRRAVRFGLSALIFASSYLLRKHLSFIVALSSALCVVCSVSLTLPIIIYIATFWNESSIVNKIFHFILLGICIFIGALDAVNDFANVF